MGGHRAWTEGYLACQTKEASAVKVKDGKWLLDTITQDQVQGRGRTEVVISTAV